MSADGAPAIELRPARADDALCLSVLATQVFLDTYATEGIRPTIAREVLAGCAESAFLRAADDAATSLVVAERAGHLVGFAQVALGAAHDLAPPGAPAELVRLYVQQPFAGRQLGTWLLRDAERRAAEAGATVMWLTAWAHNERALRYYARRGYVDRGATTYRFEDESHPNRLFARSLADYLPGSRYGAAASSSMR